MAGDTPLPIPPQPHPGPLLVGYSGGLDSTTLLHRLAGDASLRAQGLRALHVHHGLHPEADAWARHCRRQCEALGIALAVVEVAVARDGGEGLEAAARAARHAAFAAALGDGEVLALAHHRDDQAETFLLRALRASGSEGLGAMRPWRRYGRGWLWRPLLDLPRSALQAHAERSALAWIEDPSNASEAHDRNYLRRQVLPQLQARWPQVASAFAHAAALQREAADLLAEGDRAALARARGVDPLCLDVQALRDLPAPRQARILRRWVEDIGLPPLPGQGVAQVQRVLLRADAPGDAPQFAWRDAVIRRWRGLLWAGRRLPDLPPGTRLAWDGSAPLPWPGGGRLALQGASSPRPESGHAAPFVVHAREGGERITLPGRRHSHALKHVLQDLGIPPWLRARLPLLSHADGSLLAAGDLVFSARFDAWLRAGRRQLHWLRGMDASSHPRAAPLE